MIDAREKLVRISKIYSVLKSHVIRMRKIKFAEDYRKLTSSGSLDEGAWGFITVLISIPYLFKTSLINLEGVLTSSIVGQLYIPDVYVLVYSSCMMLCSVPGKYYESIKNNWPEDNGVYYRGFSSLSVSFSILLCLLGVFSLFECKFTIALQFFVSASIVLVGRIIISCITVFSNTDWRELIFDLVDPVFFKSIFFLLGLISFVSLMFMYIS